MVVRNLGANGGTLLYGVRIDGGAQRTVLSRNEIHGDKQEPLAVADAPGIR
ncbi:hypothetical protein ABT237_18575 [Streptomyces sp. NPDC001581]|uniref:hypothetical protein n=1 Tax=Streptomyces sp. NPDC001581 TaxID=3154386 RepID=UPI003325A7A4